MQRNATQHNNSENGEKEAERENDDEINIKVYKIYCLDYKTCVGHNDYYCCKAIIMVNFSFSQ